MKIYLFIAVLILFCGCSKEHYFGTDKQIGGGSVITQNLSLTPFHEVELQNYCNVEIIKSTSCKVEVSDYENIIQYLNFEIIGNKLSIKTVPPNISITNSKAKAVIHTPGIITSLKIYGSGNITLKSQFDHVTYLNISGSGNIIGEVASQLNNLHASISGSGNITFLNMQSQTVDCVISGSGNCSVSVLGALNALISGSGNVFYQGDPSVKMQVTGSGSIVKL